MKIITAIILTFGLSLNLLSQIILSGTVTDQGAWPGST